MTASHRLAVIALGFLLNLSAGRAEDWTTTDGKIYKDVKVVKVEADAVTILDSDGGARVSLSMLPPDLQKKFNYDPVKAAAAAEQYQAEQDALARANDAQKAQNPAATDALSSQVEASKIRLIGKVLTKVAGGYILGGIFAADGYTVKLDQNRPDYQYVNNIAHGSPVFLQTPDDSHDPGYIIDADVYPMGKYISSPGETMPAFTTEASSAKAWLKFKQGK